MKIVFLFALLGCALALQGPVEYEYKYEARIGTGLQAARPQYAGTGIKADVRITMQEDGTGEIQLKNVRVGEGNEELLDNGKDILPINFQPIEDRSIEQPFKAHFRKQDGDTVLEVPSNDLMWVTNVRRGVANFFRIAPIVQPGSVPHPEPNSELLYGYSKIMDTFAGRCRVQYSIAPAPQSHNGPSIREDIQSQRAPKGPGGLQVKLEEELHLVKSSIDFSTCSNRVFLTQTGAGNLTNVTSSSYRDVASRSHVGEFILKGKPGQFRIQRGDVESAVILQPFGIESAKMVIMSNQSMVLLSAKPAPRNVQASSANLRPIKTWNQQVQSPKPQPEDFVPRFIQYKSQNEPQLSPILYERLTSGFQFNNEAMQENFLTRAEQTIHKIADRCRAQNRDSTEQPEQYGGSEDGRIAQGMRDVMYLLRTLNHGKVQELDEKMMQKNDELVRQIYVDALAVAASGPTLKVLLQKIRSHQLSDNRTASIFFNLANNIKTPEIVEELVDLAMSMNEEKNVTASLLIKNNVARIVRRMCVSSEIKQYSHMMYAFGSKRCDRNKVVHKYLPHLETRIKGSSKTWVKILNVIAVADMGAREGIDILEQVARGDLSHDIFVRYAAIHGLSAFNFDNSSQDQIFNVLQPIAESRVEDYRIRQVAYDSLLTFRPNVTFLQRMIFASHNEPSQQVQSYISWVIDSLSKIEDPSYRPLSTAARNALALTRYMPASPHRPANYIFSRYLHGDQVGSRGEDGWLSQYKSTFPREVYSFVAGKFGRFDIPLMESITFGNSQAAYAKFRSAAEEFTKKKGPVSPQEEERKQRLHNQFHSMHGGSRHNLDSSDQQEPDLFHFTRLWRTSEVFLPLTNELYQQTKGYMQSMLRSMSQGQEKDVVFFKYLNPVESDIILPTAPGLFMKIELNSPTVLFGQVKMQAKTTPRISDPSDLPTLQKINFKAEGIVKAITKTNSYSKILAPWTNVTVVCGVDLEKSVSLPLKYEIEADLQVPAQILWAKLTPQFNQTSGNTPVIKIRNVPFTGLSGLVPTLEGASTSRRSRVDNGGFRDFKRVLWVDSPDKWFRESWSFSKANTGLNAKFDYKGGPQPPFSQNNVMRLFKEPSRLISLLVSPSIKNYELSIYQPSEQPTTKSIGLSFRFLQQQGSGEEISQASATKPIDVSPEDTIQQREQKLKKFSDQENYEVSAQLNFTGSSADQNKIYEVIIITASQEKQGPSSDFKTEARKIQVAVVEKNKESQRPPKTCAVVAQLKPQLTPLLRKSAFAQGVKIISNIDGNVYQGQACSAGGQSAANGKAVLDVSEERLEAIRNITGDIPMSMGNSSEFYRLASYDQLQMTVSWQNPSITLKNVTMRAQDLVEGYLFPKIVKNRLQSNKPNQMVVEAQRFVGDNRANARVQLPHQTVDAETLKVNSFFDPIVSFAPSELQPQRLMSISGAKKFRAPSGKGCLVKPDQVKTFDGVSYTKPTTGCPIAAVRVSQGQDNIAVLTSQPSKSASGPQEVKVISTKSGLEIDVNGQNVKINGQPMSQQSKVVKDSSGNTVAKVSKASDLVSISVTKKMEIAIKQGNLVMIKLDQRFKNVAKGLCGDYNSDTKNDLTGPQRCLFKPEDGNKYAAAWVADESSCQEPAMKSLFDQLIRYKEHCEKNPKQALSRSSQCSQAIKVHPIAQTGVEICVGKSQVLHCKSGCDSTSTRTVPMPSKCWLESTAPQEVRENLSKGFMTSLPTEQADSERTVQQKSPRACTQGQLSARRRSGRRESTDCSEVLTVFPLTMHGEEYCVGEQKVPRCSENCGPQKTMNVRMQTKCWSPSKAPQSVMQSAAQGYMEELPTEKAEFIREMSHKAELHCAPEDQSLQGQNQHQRRQQSIEGQQYRRQQQQRNQQSVEGQQFHRQQQQRNQQSVEGQQHHGQQQQRNQQSVEGQQHHGQQQQRNQQSLEGQQHRGQHQQRNQQSLERQQHRGQEQQRNQQSLEGQQHRGQQQQRNQQSLEGQQYHGQQQQRNQQSLEGQQQQRHQQSAEGQQNRGQQHQRHQQSVEGQQNRGQQQQRWQQSVERQQYHEQQQQQQRHQQSVEGQQQQRWQQGQQQGSRQSVEGQQQQWQQGQQQQNSRAHHRQVTPGNDADCFINTAYPVRSVGSELCVTKEPTKVCKQECRLGDTVPTAHEMKCWAKQNAPAAVKQAERQGYTTAPVSQKEERVMELSIQVPRTCFHREH